jgi:phage terminase large subunit-like protein
MTDILEASALDRWQKEPILFIEQILRNPETGKPFELLDAERAFLAHAFQTDESGRLVYPEQLYACPKKSGKTGLAAMHLLTTTLVFERGRQCAQRHGCSCNCACSRKFRAFHQRICPRRRLWWRWRR